MTRNGRYECPKLVDVFTRDDDGHAVDDVDEIRGKTKCCGVVREEKGICMGCFVCFQ